MKKKVLCLLLAVAFAFTAPATLASAAAAPIGTSGASWELRDGTTLKITGTGAMPNFNWENLEARPWHDDSENITTVEIAAGITHIGNSAFDEMFALETITFAGDSRLKTIGEYAFYDASLTSVTIPASVTNIGEGAFQYCRDLETVTFAKKSQLKTISNWAFNHTALTAVTIPASVTSIGTQAFSNTSLTTVTIPASVTTIGEGAFGRCNSLITATFFASTPPAFGIWVFYDTHDDLEIFVPLGAGAAYKSVENLEVWANRIVESEFAVPPTGFDDTATSAGIAIVLLVLSAGLWGYIILRNNIDKKSV